MGIPRRAPRLARHENPRPRRRRLARGEEPDRRVVVRPARRGEHVWRRARDEVRARDAAEERGRDEAKRQVRVRQVATKRRAVDRAIPETLGRGTETADERLREITGRVRIRERDAETVD